MCKTKIIWMYWAQGWDTAPELVKLCRQSWKSLNPEYKVIALDDISLKEYIDIPDAISVNRPDVPVQKISNLIRVGVLSKHGGVWADATVMCSTPLKDWLPEYYSTGFFAFRNPGKDRMLSSWFLASEPGNILVERWHKDYSAFLMQNRFPNQNNIRGSLLRAIFRKKWNGSVETTTNWHSSFARKKLKTYPYFIFHYTFNRIILNDTSCREIWENAKPFDAEMPHKVQRFSRKPERLREAVDFISLGQAPVHKLNWRKDTNSPYWKEVIRLLEEDHL